MGRGRCPPHPRRPARPLSRCQPRRQVDGCRPLKDKTLAELKALDVGSWFAPRFKGEKILTLADAFNLARGQINLYLDAKEIDPKQLAREIIDAQMTRQVVVYGDLPTIERVSKASENKIAVMTKWRPSLGSPSSFLSNHPLHAVEIDPQDISPDVCESFHSLGVKVQAKALGSTHDQPAFWITCANSGVDWIQTDEPIAVLMTLARHRIGHRWPVASPATEAPRATPPKTPYRPSNSLRVCKPTTSKSTSAPPRMASSFSSTTAEPTAPRASKVR